MRFVGDATVFRNRRNRSRLFYSLVSSSRFSIVRKKIIRDKFKPRLPCIERDSRDAVARTRTRSAGFVCPRHPRSATQSVPLRGSTLDKGCVVQTKIRVVRRKMTTIVPVNDEASGRSALNRGTGGARCQTITTTWLDR